MFGKRIKYEKSISLEGYNLKYQGAGTRKALVFDIYSAALYANQKFTSTLDAIESDIPKIFVIDILTPLLNGHLLAQIFKDTLARTEYGKLPEIEGDIDDIVNLFKNGKLTRYDRFMFLYAPDTGFIAYQNGVKEYTCPNPNLIKAVLEVFLGGYLKDQELPKKIVGL